jgi:hypothetical protein
MLYSGYTMKTSKSLGTLVTEAMEKNGLWAAELSRISGVSTQVISKVVNDHTGCGPWNAVALGNALGLDPVLFDRRANTARAARKTRASRRRGGPQRPPVASPSGDVARQGT